MFFTTKQLSLILGTCLALGANLAAQSLPIVTTYVETDLVSQVAAIDLGDVDGDGADDFGLIIGHPIGTGLMIGTEGVVVSGATGTPIADYTPSASPSIAVADLYPCGDLDGDNCAEYLSLKLPGATPDYELRLHDGASTATFFTINFGPQTDFRVLASRAMGDRDGDGIKDIGIAYQSSVSTAAALGVIGIYSGATGAAILGVGSPLLQSNGIGNVGDFDGDGIDDFFISQTEGSTLIAGPYTAGTIEVFSGANSAPLLTINGQPGQGLGFKAYPVSDLDGDGRPDILSLSIDLGALDPNQTARFETYSSATGNLIWSTMTAAGTNVFDLQLTGDTDGDGIEDFITTVQLVGIPFRLRELRSGADGSVILLYDLPALLPGAATGPLRSDQFVGDLNGDGICDQIEHEIVSSTNVTVTAHTRLGTAMFGGGPATSLSLRFDHFSLQPRLGTYEIANASSFASLIAAVSLAPASTTIAGTSFPLLVSLAFNDLVLMQNLPADAFGVYRSPSQINIPALVGTIIYLQAAEVGPVPAVSNGLEILFGD